ncbi:hypothetical protein G6F32_000022 [Rhizopus arrhizus]|nr:hypothetical protein G6F32_000022 [Rhizopus arrhizus]
MTEKRRLELKNLSKEMFQHGWSNYLEHAFPEDELNPFECSGRGSDKANPDNINVNDVLGDYSLTLVDTLDTLAIMGTQEQFEKAVRQVIDTVSFHQNNKVQVFELNIRALGGLLSAHMLITDPNFSYSIDGYNNELLDLAVNLANRLMPAFESTRTGIPYPRVNLRRGVPPTETTETCTAGAGSLILEFGLLSRLTGDEKYERAAKRALKSVWDKRSHLSLMGNVIDIQTGNWIHTASSTGAGIDSVFEYMLKAYILFGEEEYLDMFEEAYRALMIYVRDASGYVYRNVHMSTGSLMSYWIDSLSAFFPGLQVLYGDVQSAIKSHLVYYNIWRRYHALPERFDFYHKEVDLSFYPLRPEFIESTYYLYTATKDPFYLEVGEMIIQDLNNRTRVPCGFASIADVQSGKLEDRMESFMLSETLKYLYLLFDTDHPVNKLDSNTIFTTEGHLLLLPRHYLKLTQSNPRARRLISIQSNSFGTCSRYNPANYQSLYTPSKLDMTSVPYQPQADYASHIVGCHNLPLPPLSSYAYCDSPWTTAKRFDLSFGSLKKANSVIEVLGDYLVKSLSGLKFELSGGKRNDGFIVKRELDAIIPFLSYNPDLIQLEVKQSGLTVYRNYMNADHEVILRASNRHQCVEMLGYTSDFGSQMVQLDNMPLQVFGDQARFLGCEPFSEEDIKEIKGNVLMLSRGKCGFHVKALHAQQAGAVGVVFLSNKSSLFRPSSTDVTVDIDIPCILIPHPNSILLLEQTRLISMETLPLIDPEYRLLLKGKQVDNVMIV